jgi:hypothetical protein
LGPARKSGEASAIRHGRTDTADDPMLLRYKRNQVRTIARNSWIASGGDKDKAIALAKQQVGSVILSAILIGVAIQLIVKLIEYWWNNRISEPQAIYMPGEPGFEDGE